MVSAAALVDETINEYLMTGQRSSRAWLNGAVDDAVTALTVQDVQGGIYPGSLLQAEFELAEVRSYTDPIATVVRGDYGTTAAAHADDIAIEIDPIFPRQRVLDAINQEILSLNGDPMIYVPTTLTFQSVDEDDIYDLGTDTIYGIIAVDQLVDGLWIPADNYEIVYGLTGQTGFTGDVGLSIYQAAPAETTRVIYKAPLTSITAATADVAATVGIPNVALLQLGAVLHLTAGREIKRTFIEHQGSSRRANEVAPFQTTAATREIKAMHKKLRTELVASLYQRYPLRRNRR